MNQEKREEQGRRKGVKRDKRKERRNETMAEITGGRKRQEKVGERNKSPRRNRKTETERAQRGG